MIHPRIQHQESATAKAAACIGAPIRPWPTASRRPVARPREVDMRIADGRTAVTPARVIIGAAVFALGLMIGVGVAAWLVPPA
jgi:hypothetical protein